MFSLGLLLDRRKSPGVFFLEVSSEDSSWKNSSEKTQLAILGILPVDSTTDTQEGGSGPFGLHASVVLNNCSSKIS